MLKAYRYRIYPDDMQKIQLAKTFGCVRFVYNYYLDKKIQQYKETKRSMSKTECNNDLNRNVKEEYQWLREVDKFALTNAIYNLDAAYKNFFQSTVVGFPKFKSKSSHDYSYKTNYTNQNIEVDFEGNQIKLPKLKWVKAKVHRVFQGHIQSAAIRQVPSGKYYVSILVEENIDVRAADLRLLEPSGKTIGFDLGIKEFMIDSNGRHEANPRLLQKYEKKLAKEQRILARKQKGSKNREKQRIKVARIHEKIANVRKDHTDQLSAKIVNENQVIISEDLQISNMVRNHNLSKAILDVSWGDFLRKIEYKARWNGKVYHKVSPWYASSQICSACGKKNEKVKLLSVRQWECECGAVHQRDENAAINILRQGMLELECT